MKFVPVKNTGVLFCIWDKRVQDFAAFVKATGYDATGGVSSLHADEVKYGVDTWESPGFKQGPTHPVCGLSWEDARAFCNWLTKKERAEGRLTANQQYRLPTDAEWSVAVGLGPETGDSPKQKDGKIKGVYPWGTQWPPPKGAGNYAGEESKEGAPSGWKVIEGYNDGYPRTSPVGSFPANPFGLYDMGGNLWQWCEDLYTPDGVARVLRGASWHGKVSAYLLSSCRRSGRPGTRDDGYGFRCVLVVGAPPLP
jgi:formylglycine-generating enzyme required for sulfatase activity